MSEACASPFPTTYVHIEPAQFGEGSYGYVVTMRSDDWRQVEQLLGDVGGYISDTLLSLPLAQMVSIHFDASQIPPIFEAIARIDGITNDRDWLVPVYIEVKAESRIDAESIVNGAIEYMLEIQDHRLMTTATIGEPIEIALPYHTLVPPDDESLVNDDFPMSVEYDGLWGGSDFQNEVTAQEEARHEAEIFGGDA